jgi:hypothetical protein
MTKLIIKNGERIYLDGRGLITSQPDKLLSIPIKKYHYGKWYLKLWFKIKKYLK